MLEQGILKQPVEQRVEHTGRNRWALATELRIARGDPPDHVFEALVDFDDVLAEGVLEQRLGPQIVPEAVHARVFAEGFGELDEKALHEFLATLRTGRDLIV